MKTILLVLSGALSLIGLFILISTSRQKSATRLSPNGTPADPVESQHWLIERLANSHAKKMNLGGKSCVLLPEIGQLDGHLRELEISHSKISDFSALRGLPSLEKLKILASPFSDYSILASLKNLKELELILTGDADGRVEVPDLPELRFLHVSNKHGDIVLGKLPKLEKAEFDVLGDLSQVIRQPRLEELKFNKILDPTLEPLMDASSIKKLHCWLHGPMDLGPIAALTELDQLFLVAPEVFDISALGKLTNLSKLDLYAKQVTDAGPLKHLTNLASLLLKFDTPLNDLSFLSGMKDLSYLYISVSNTVDLNALTNLLHLQMLSLLGIGPDVSLSPLTSCLSLENLVISTDKSLVEHVTQPLPTPPNLSHLKLNWNGLETLNGLENCRYLQFLECSYTDIDSLKPLEGMKHLKELHVAGSNVSDLSILLTLPHFVQEDPDISLSVGNTPAIKRYPELANIVERKFWPDSNNEVGHKTALKAIRAVRRNY